MKRRMNLAGMVLVLPWMALLSSAHTVSAYYDPGVQRWVNRDPIAETGVKLILHIITFGMEDENIDLYEFVGNNPQSGFVKITV